MMCAKIYFSIIGFILLSLILACIIPGIVEHIEKKQHKRYLRKEFESLEIGSKWVFRPSDPDPFTRKSIILILDKKMGTDGKTPFVKYKYDMSGLESTSDLESFLRVFLKLY